MNAEEEDKEEQVEEEEGVKVLQEEQGALSKATTWLHMLEECPELRWIAGRQKYTQT